MITVNLSAYLSQRLYLAKRLIFIQIKLIALVVYKECVHVCWVVCVLYLAVLPSNSWDIYSIHNKAKGAKEQSIGLRSHGN